METPPGGRRGSYSVVAEDWLLLLEPPVGAAVVAAADWEPLVPDVLPLTLEVLLLAVVEDCLFEEVLEVMEDFGDWVEVLVAEEPNGWVSG